VARGVEEPGNRADIKRGRVRMAAVEQAEGGSMSVEQRIFNDWVRDRDLRAVHRPTETEIDILRQVRMPGVAPDKQLFSDLLVAIRKLEMRNEE